jgi:hypothetical protein
VGERRALTRRSPRTRRRPVVLTLA